MPVANFKGEKTSAESVPAVSPSAPEPEFHVTFVDTALPPVSLFRQIRDRLREPKNPVPKVFPSSKGSPVPGAEFHATFVDTTLAPISLFRQIRQRFREPKVPLQSEYYRRGADAGSAGNSVVSGGEFHATFVERTLPPVSLFRQIVAGIHEPKTPGPIRPGHVTSATGGSAYRRFRKTRTSSIFSRVPRPPPRRSQSPSISRRGGRIITSCWSSIRRP